MGLENKHYAIIGIASAIVVAAIVIVIIFVVNPIIPDPSSDETVITLLKLASPFDDSALEYSGLAWYNDTVLILLPENPTDHIYMLHRDDVVAYLDSAMDDGIVLETIGFTVSGELSIDDFQGYESIVFDGDVAYLTIEAGTLGIASYMVQGSFSLEDGLVIDASSKVSLDMPVEILNYGHESLFMDGNTPVAIYEWNRYSNADTLSFADRVMGGTIERVVFPSIPYRITDATSLDAENNFWVINYLYPGDGWRVSDYPYAEYLTGTHSVLPQVEAIIQLNYNNETNGVTRVDRAPVLLALEREGRNWEGLVRFEAGNYTGFLTITDQHPSSLFAYVPCDSI
eukprot:TRINITY_DN6268_c0_g1_i1.p1 TRINITY_DN6268_c0_g1~~TRINITY_DN6268_c0_g1_i1.p1  ORF type:complete len:351 (-),score=79.90 TRINITY_DN6268_c0_g1_i1:16-1041(-)